MSLPFHRQGGCGAAWILAFAGMAGVLLVGAARAETKPWRHGIVEAKNDAGFVMMPGQPGFADKQGLDLQFVQLKGDALLIKALLSGDLDSYEANPGSAIIAASRGADVKVVGCTFPGLMYGLFTQADIGSVADLKGKMFAISGPGSLPDLVARAMLEQAHVPATAVRFAVMGSDADRYRALSVGVVNAAAVSTEFVPLAATAHLKMLVDARTALPNYLRFCTYVSGKTLRERPHEVAALLAAQMEGVSYALAHRDETIALTGKTIHLPADDPRPAFVYEQIKAGGLVDPAVPLPVDKLQWMEDLLVKTGNVAKPFDVATMADGSARAEALGRVAPR